MITIKKMAQILGVSTTTVSNVIHGKTKEVSSETIKRVQALVDKYEYVPNINARNLATNNSNIIGVAIKTIKCKYENPINDPFVSELLGTIEKEIRKKEYFMMLYISDNINEILKCITTWNVDGVIFLGMDESDLGMIKKKYKKPTVYIDSYFYNEKKEFVRVGIEDAKGAYEMTKYLIECGHKKIAFFTDNGQGLDCERFNGYKRALDDFNITFNKEDLIIVNTVNENMDYFLKEVYEICNKYTALFCMSDYYAVLLMNYFIDRGKCIPDDFSIVGYDNVGYAQLSRPMLTTVNQDIDKKGKIATKLLIDMIKGEIIENNNVILPTELVIRESVKIINK